MSTPLTDAPLHVPWVQTVPVTNLRQAPAPLQVPSRPQLATSAFGQRLSVRGFSPVGTKAQIPGEPATLQAMHVSPQRLLQQTPSTQNPLVQLASQPHVAPFAAGAVLLHTPPSGLGLDFPEQPSANAATSTKPSLNKPSRIAATPPQPRSPPRA